MNCVEEEEWEAKVGSGKKERGGGQKVQFIEWEERERRMASGGHFHFIAIATGNTTSNKDFSLGADELMNTKDLLRVILLLVYDLNSNVLLQWSSLIWATSMRSLGR